MTATPSAPRIEKDLLGPREIPAEAYWGIHTLRALENFPVTGVPISTYPELVKALALVKKAAALANLELGLLPGDKARVILAACDEIAGGLLHDQFVVDVIQGGAGTSTNMNANEVIANRALELMGRAKGEYAALHPIDDVNLAQSTNDVYPTALRVGLHFAVLGLLEAMAALRQALEDKSEEFMPLLKVGRTQLQDAVPMTLGQEFRAFAIMVGEDERRILESLSLINEVNLGATAIGTGINAHPKYAGLACGRLAELTELDIVPAAFLVEATQDTGALVQVSGVLKRFATKISKICNDLRLLSSGPRAGFGEITLPARAAGSSIMPGKVNPVIPEMVNQVAFEVIGNDVTVTMAAEGGQLQLNAFEPIMAHSLFKSVNHLKAACRILAERCVAGITANTEVMRAHLDRSAALATALNPYIGYEQASALAKEALATGRSVRELVLEKGLLTPEEMERVLAPEILTQPSMIMDLVGKAHGNGGGK
jgi:aspartate ammonia-lyase